MPAPLASVAESMSAWSMRVVVPLNSTSLLWCTTRSINATASLSSPRTVPHFLNSMLVDDEASSRSSPTPPGRAAARPGDVDRDVAELVQDREVGVGVPQRAVELAVRAGALQLHNQARRRAEPHRATHRDGPHAHRRREVGLAPPGPAVEHEALGGVQEGERLRGRPARSRRGKATCRSRRSLERLDLREPGLRMSRAPPVHVAASPALRTGACWPRDPRRRRPRPGSPHDVARYEEPSRSPPAPRRATTSPAYPSATTPARDGRGFLGEVDGLVVGDLARLPRGRRPGPRRVSILPDALRAPTRRARSRPHPDSAHWSRMHLTALPSPLRSRASSMLPKVVRNALTLLSAARRRPVGEQRQLGRGVRGVGGRVAVGARARRRRRRRRPSPRPSSPRARTTISPPGAHSGDVEYQCLPSTRTLPLLVGARPPVLDALERASRSASIAASRPRTARAQAAPSCSAPCATCRATSPTVSRCTRRRPTPRDRDEEVPPLRP